jgi:hypothetical protein
VVWEPIPVTPQDLAFIEAAKAVNEMFISGHIRPMTPEERAIPLGTTTVQIGAAESRLFAKTATGWEDLGAVSDFQGPCMTNAPQPSKEDEPKTLLGFPASYVNEHAIEVAKSLVGRVFKYTPGERD